MKRSEAETAAVAAVIPARPMTREADPKGDRVTITMNGKFLPYKTY
jgi:cyanate lyase